jgi:hypothetical protein
MKDGLKKRNLVANGKLLTIKSQPLSPMSDISTMTKGRAEQALVARLTRGLNEGSNPLTRSDRSASCGRRLLGANRIGVSYALCAGRS